MTTSDNSDHVELLAALPDRLGGGDRTVFRQVVDLYGDRLVRYVHRYVPSQDVAQVIVRHVFQELWQRRSDLTVLRDLDEFLYATARHHATYGLTHRRAASGDDSRYTPPTLIAGSVIVGSEEPTQGNCTSEIAAAVQRAADTLPPLERETLRLRSRDYSDAEIAEAVGVPAAEVHLVLERAVQRLARTLQRQHATRA